MGKKMPSSVDNMGKTSISISETAKCSNNNINNNRHAYQCNKCFKKFSRRDHLRTHEKNIHGADAGPFVCALCSQLYKNTESLRKHIAKFHFPKVMSHNNEIGSNGGSSSEKKMEAAMKA